MSRSTPMPIAQRSPRRSRTGTSTSKSVMTGSGGPTRQEVGSSGLPTESTRSTEHSGWKARPTGGRWSQPTFPCAGREVLGEATWWSGSREGGGGNAESRLRGLRGKHKPGLIRKRDELRPVASVELAQRPADVCLRCSPADHQISGDLLVAQPGGDERHYLALARGEFVELPGAGQVGIRLGGEFADHPAHSARRERNLAGGKRPYAVSELGRLCIRRQEPAGPRAQA